MEKQGAYIDAIVFAENRSFERREPLVLEIFDGKSNEPVATFYCDPWEGSKQMHHGRGSMLPLPNDVKWILPAVTASRASPHWSA